MQHLTELDVVTATASFRSSSEDRLAVHEVQGGVVVVVADGAGGMAGGTDAAEYVLTIVNAAVADPAFRPDATSWVDLLRRADGEIQAARTAGETTAVIVHLSHDALVGAAVGDSGTLLVLDDCTVHDLAADQLPHRKRRLGSGRAVPTGFEAALPSRAVLVAATDGLVAYTRHDGLARAVFAADDLAEAADNLVDIVRLPSGSLQDDVAVVLVKRR
jgi:serine/threonine protein phosphatase PrpC